MNRMLTCLLSLAAFVFVAAKPGDQPPPANSPSAKSQDTTDANGETIVMPRRRKPIVPDPARLLKALPEEREAVRAAIVGDGGARYNDHGRVKWIICEGATDADLKLFGALPDLEELHIGPDVIKCFEYNYLQPTVSDAGLSPLLKAGKLRTLALVDTQVTNDGLKVVGQLTNLRSLVLCRTGITGYGMRHLDGLKQLEILEIVDPMAGDDGMRSVAGHTALRRLALDSSVTPKGLAELVPLTSLEVLFVDRSLKDEDMRCIGKITSLQVVNRGRLHLTDKGLGYMTGMKRLICLDLDDAKVTDAGMVYVGQMTGLEKLVLGPSITDAGVVHLSGLTNLKTLGLSRTQISDTALHTVAGLPELRSLGLSRTNVTARGVAQLRGMKKLEGVGVSGTGISAYDVQELNSIGIRVDK